MVAYDFIWRAPDRRDLESGCGLSRGWRRVHSCATLCRTGSTSPSCEGRTRTRSHREGEEQRER
jgi:hypothetical protein